MPGNAAFKKSRLKTAIIITRHYFFIIRPLLRKKKSRSMIFLHFFVKFKQRLQK
jgi:hypothetical protein